ncbi:hypothetical protein GQ53DRAFT_786529 [Thozetella sp. PMI_491]|nr:hypothetical protein GQ53DRAFT_786529 [Thozetella sp. PMI_491]
MLDDNAASERALTSDAADEIAALEATYEETAIQVNEDVEEFAGELDRFNAERGKGSPTEQRASIFKFVDNLYLYTRKRADQLQKRRLRARSTRGGSYQRATSTEMDIDEADDGSATDNSEDLQRVEEEAQTWDLLRRLLPLRYRDTSQPKLRADVPTGSRQEAWNEFLLADSSAIEKKVILEWLQNSASHGPPIDDVVRDLQRNAERGDILAHGWLHTRSKIKMQKSVNGYQGAIDPNDPSLPGSHLSSNTLITQLDPDAMTRQGRKLEPEDDFFERAIWLGCFELLRRGSTMSEIRDWCSVRTELWRAAAIAPLPLSSPQDEDQPDFDPVSLVFWRRMCFATARDGGTGDYDRAVYGLLAGDLPSVEKVCKTWDDFLFAHYNAILRTQFDTFLTRRGGEKAAAACQKLPAFAALSHGVDSGVGRRLVTSLEADPRTSGEALTVSKALQGAVISGNLDQHLYYQGIVLSKHANQRQESRLIPDLGGSVPDRVRMEKFFDLSDHDNLRVAAHVLVIIAALDELSGASQEDGPLEVRHQIQEHIVAAYVSYLRLANLAEMIPLYASKLHGPRIYHTLSRNLNQITDMSARVHQLALIKKLGLDIDEFVTIQPQIYLEDVNDREIKCEAKNKFIVLDPSQPQLQLKTGRALKLDFFGEDSDFVDNEDELIIRSMEWLMLAPGQLVVTCTYAIRIYKYLLNRVRLRAARKFFERVPCLEAIRTKAGMEIVTDDECDPAWFEDFVNGISDELLEEYEVDRDTLILNVRTWLELECLVRALDSIETISSLAALSQTEGSAHARDFYKAAGEEIRSAKACMQPVLKNWLKGVKDADPDFQVLREHYIPETILGFVSSLHFVGTSLSRDNLLECMELAAVIADKDSDVAKEFLRSGRMKELLESFASCSKALAIFATEKKGTQSSSKKLREMGWSKELWSIKP